MNKESTIESLVCLHLQGVEGLREYEKLALSPNVITGAMATRMATLGKMAPGIGQTALASRTQGQVKGIMSHVVGQEKGTLNALRQGAAQGQGARRIQGLADAHGIAKQNTGQVLHAGNQALNGVVPHIDNSRQLGGGLRNHWRPVPNGSATPPAPIGSLSGHTDEMQHLYGVQPRVSPLLTRARPSAAPAVPQPLRIAG